MTSIEMKKASPTISHINIAISPTHHAMYRKSPSQQRCALEYGVCSYALEIGNHNGSPSYDHPHHHLVP